MREREQPMMKTLNVSDSRRQFNQLLNQVYRGETRVLVEKSGIPVAAIVSTADLRRLQQLDEARQRALQALEVTGAAFQDVPEEELEREIEQAVAEVRAERRRTAPRIAAATKP